MSLIKILKKIKKKKTVYIYTKSFQIQNLVIDKKELKCYNGKEFIIPILNKTYKKNEKIGEYIKTKKSPRNFERWKNKK